MIVGIRRYVRLRAGYRPDEKAGRSRANHRHRCPRPYHHRGQQTPQHESFGIVLALPVKVFKTLIFPCALPTSGF